MNGYGSEMDASPPFFWEAVGPKHGLMLHRKIMWRDRYSATGCSPALQAVDRKQAENLSVGKTKSYWTNNTLGEYLRRHCFFAPVREQVHISQKTVRYRPVEKVLDGLLDILCGAKTISQSNITIRVDPAVQRAFGRTGCAEQSTIARTLQASTPETVAQLSRVSWYYLKRYGQTPHHRFAERLLWVDVDVTPLPIGAQAEGSERTWMGRNRSKTGRKTLRVTASDYREIPHSNGFNGKVLDR